MFLLLCCCSPGQRRSRCLPSRPALSRQCLPLRMGSRHSVCRPATSLDYSDERGGQGRHTEHTQLREHDEPAQSADEPADENGKALRIGWRAFLVCRGWLRVGRGCTGEPFLFGVCQCRVTLSENELSQPQSCRSSMHVPPCTYPRCLQVFAGLAPRVPTRCSSHDLH